MSGRARFACVISALSGGGLGICDDGLVAPEYGGVNRWLQHVVVGPFLSGSGPVAGAGRAAGRRAPGVEQGSRGPPLKMACDRPTLAGPESGAAQAGNRTANRPGSRPRAAGSGDLVSLYPRKWRPIVQDLAAGSGPRAGREPAANRSRPRAAGSGILGSPPPKMASDRPSIFCCSGPRAGREPGSDGRVLRHDRLAFSVIVDVEKGARRCRTGQNRSVAIAVPGPLDLCARHRQGRL